MFHRGFHWVSPPRSELKVQVERMEDGKELRIEAFQATLILRGWVAFELASSGRLMVWEGEVEVLEGNGEKTTRVEAGQQLALPVPPEVGRSDSEASGKADPAGDRGVEEYLETTKERSEPVREAVETIGRIAGTLDPSPESQGHRTEPAETLEGD